MAYTNVTPPAIPAYDTETNGFYVLVFNYEQGAEDWYMVHLIYGAWRFQYENGVGVTNTGNTYTRTYSDGSWSEERQNTETLALNPGERGGVYQRIYTNENIFAGEKIWLAADTVTPVEKFPVRDFLIGMILGSLSRGHFPQREPVAFLYGHVAKEGETPTHTINGVDYVGVVAPDIKETYPYAVVWKTYDGKYILRYTEHSVTVREDKSQYSITFFDWPRVAYSEYILDTNSNTWVLSSSGTSQGQSGNFMQFAGSATSGMPDLIWANHDVFVYQNSSALYLADSDPVPIYE